MEFTHIDNKGEARMVDVSDKHETQREAIARGAIYMKPETVKMILERAIPKGDVITVARVAGIMAAKRTSDLIPMCHPLNITYVSIDISVEEEKSMLAIESKVRTVGPTGVEMEALTAVSVAALTIYDMCKAVDKEMTISDIMLIQKKGGKSGDFSRRSPLDNL